MERRRIQHLLGIAASRVVDVLADIEETHRGCNPNTCDLCHLARLMVPSVELYADSADASAPLDVIQRVHRQPNEPLSVGATLV
jgi:hypothetical protein